MDHRTPTEPPKQDSEPLVEVRNLQVSFATRRGTVHAVNGVDLILREAQSIGLVGESGSGKSVTCRALLGLLPEYATVSADMIRLSGTDVAGDREGHAGMRGGMALVGQDPIGALNPHVPVGTQIDRVLLNRGMQPARASERTSALLDEVGIDPLRRNAWPAEFSGGMCQRISIALALATGARVLIADEPTSSLDVTTQTRILELLERLRVTEGLSLVLVTHDLDLAAGMCERLLVMYGGLVVEEGEPREVAAHAAHPYTRGLLAAVPRLSSSVRHVEGIRGSAPVIDRPLRSCPFAARCDLADRACSEAVPASRSVGPTRVRCVHPQHGSPTSPGIESARTYGTTRALDGVPVLRVEGLTVSYRIRRGIFLGRETGRIDALRDVGLAVDAGEVLGVIGETGAGKSTLLRALLRLEPEAIGSIELDGVDVSRMTEPEFRPYRERIQTVFQNPAGALDPSYCAWRAVAEPLEHLGAGDRRSRWRAARDALAACGLATAVAARPTSEFSGGQKQRIAISRAIVDPPRLLLADEPVSALDVSVQAGVINLLRTLVSELGFALIFVSHDLAVVRLVAHTVLVLQGGVVQEYGPADEFFRRPGSAYGRELMLAAGWSGNRQVLDG